MLRVYLSGRMQGRYVWEVVAERSEATKELAKGGIHALDPAAAEEKLWPSGRHAKIALKPPPKIMEAMVKRDLWLIRRCDVLLVLTGDVPSDGTWWEMVFAKFIGIPVVMVAPNRASGDLNGWSTVMISKDHIFADIKSAVRFIKKTYLKDYDDNREYFNAAIKNAKYAFTHKKPLTNRKKRGKLRVKRYGSRRRSRRPS